LKVIDDLKMQPMTFQKYLQRILPFISGYRLTEPT